MNPTSDRTNLLHRWRRLIVKFQLRLSRADAIVELSLLGLVSGIIAGLVSIMFRLIVERFQEAILSGPAGSYETLSSLQRLWLPIAGGLFIGLLLQRCEARQRIVGIVHVMERLQFFQGRFPLSNALVQFLGGAVALISGHSVGREGPGVHLGVAGSNLPAQYLHLPNNTLRVLAACGTAAAIAASFNTPLAGVAFAMEVLMFEYTVAAFAPVVLAAVSATALSQMVFGTDLAFTVPALSLGSLYELPYVFVMGMIIGALSALFIRMLRLTFGWAPRVPVWLRGTLAGLIIGLIGFFVPEVMGIGYDTVNHLIVGELALWLVLTIIALKLIASTTAVGLGIPGGLIGPALVVGAATGGTFAYIAQYWGLVEPSATGFYVLLGMGAMMAGTLQAPLAGLIAILELTGNPNIIFPGMLAVIAATLTSGQLHGRESMYVAVLRAMGRDYRNDPITQSLRKVGVGAVMNRSVVSLPQHVAREELDAALKETPRWILIREKDAPVMLLPALDVARILKEDPELTQIDLMAVPGERYQAGAIDFQATLQEARERLEERGVEVLYVTRTTVPGISRVFGILTTEDIENSYRY